MVADDVSQQLRPFGVAKSRGGDLATHAMSGGRVEAHHHEPLAVSAEPVCVSWIGRPDSFPGPTVPLMLVGQANGTVVLYEFRAEHPQLGSPLRVPASDVVLERAGGAGPPWTCGAVIP